MDTSSSSKNKKAVDPEVSEKSLKSDKALKLEKSAKTAKVATVENEEPDLEKVVIPHDHFSKDELAHFRKVLEDERLAVLAKAREALNSGSIKIDTNEMMDDVDLATATIDQNLTFRLLDRDRKLLSAIEKALEKLETGEFGYCEGTGELIPKRRLELRPWCRYSVKYKEQLEKAKKSGRGVADEEEF